MITVVGGSGFVGRHLLGRLRALGVEHRAPGRGAALDGRELGNVVYCAGVTGDFRERTFDTVEAHVGLLRRLLQSGRLDSLVYLSSTRLYRAPGTATEGDTLALAPGDPDHLYDLSKALGEALALAWPGRAVVVRLANVYGVDPPAATFLSSVLHDAVSHGEVTLRSTLDSTRNYVSVDDVVSAILGLLETDAQGIFNVAGARAVSHRELTEALSALTGCAVRVAPGAGTHTAPDISIERLRATIDYAPESLLDALPRLVRRS